MSQMKNRDGNKPRRAARQEQAKVRQAKYEAKTVQERLAALDKAGLTATKERKKLQDQAAKASGKAAQAAPVAPGKAQKASPAPKASPKGKKAQKGA